MQKVKNTIPVYDICTIGGENHINEDIIAEPFAAYLVQHPNLHAAHRHSFYHMVLFTKGGGYHTVDFEQFTVKPGQVYFMSPGQVHSWNFKGDMDGYIINFSEEIISSFLADNDYLQQFSFFRGIPADAVINLPRAAVEDVKATMEKIVREAHQPAQASKEMIAALLTELFITIQRNVSNGHNPAIAQPNLVILNNFRQLVNTYYAEKRLPKEYAALLYITPNHLNALCKDLLGKPAGEVIRDRILLEVKRLLINADISMSEIAFRLNFSDNSHFTKFFKKYTNTTPEEFRKKALGNY